MKVFGERLKILRLKKYLTLKQLGDEIGIKDIALNQCEKGYYAISISNIIKIAQYFNVTIDYLVGLDNNS